MEYLKNNFEWMVTLLALGLAAWSAFSAHGSKTEARKAREIAQDAAASSKLAANAAERSAQADETMAAIATADKAAAEEELARRPWQFEKLSEHRVRVTNVGPTAFDVDILMEAQFLDIEGDDSSNMETNDSRVLVYNLAGEHTGEVKIRWSRVDEPGSERFEQRWRM